MKKIDLKNYWLKIWLKSSQLDIIIQNELNISKSGLFLVEEIDEKISENIVKKFKRLQDWEPLEYIIKNAEFYNLDFYVDNRVLIPRNDTEIMVEIAIKQINNLNDVLLIDVWTWSSCIPISINKNCKDINETLAIDISLDALEVSKTNIKNHNLKWKISQINSDLLTTILKNKFSHKNLVITANLPYIKNNDFENMSKETIIYEPNIALFWWIDTWFELYEKLIKQIITLKNNNNFENIILFIEIWFDQELYSKNYLNELWFKFEYFKDNNQINRCIKIVF